MCKAALIHLLLHPLKNFKAFYEHHKLPEMPDSYLKEPEKSKKLPSEHLQMTVVTSHAIKKVDETVKKRYSHLFQFLSSVFFFRELFMKNGQQYVFTTADQFRVKTD